MVTVQASPLEVQTSEHVCNEVRVAGVLGPAALLSAQSVARQSCPFVVCTRGILPQVAQSRS